MKREATNLRESFCLKKIYNLTSLDLAPYRWTKSNVTAAAEPLIFNMETARSIL